MSWRATSLAIGLSLLASGAGGVSGSPAVEPRQRILVGAGAPPLEHYAARELQRYLLQLHGAWFSVSTNAGDGGVVFIIGQRHTNPAIKRLVAEGRFSVAPNDPGPQGYVLKTLHRENGLTVAIAGSDELGCLYGVYGFLEDHGGVGFYPSGDVLPSRRTAFTLPEVNETKAPAMAVRGLLPWSNFPQSSTVYSWNDWRLLLDQMARMRLNLLLLHNYTGERGYNEPFAMFSWRGKTARGSFATARSGHVWHGPGWDVNQYRFGAADLFDDYDFGAECSLHNETLSNEEVARKGAFLLQQIIRFAHTRGIRVGLGLDLDTLPAEYQARADDPEIVAARVRQVTSDYPDLDYLVCFQSEEAAKDSLFQQRWRRIFDGFYQGVKATRPSIRLAVSGWGLDPAAVAALPPDVVCAPIAKYSDRFEDGAAYGRREYWGGPWLERDQVSSQYYYPYNMHLSRTLAAYQRRAPNMSGLFGLTWRLSDAIEPKVSYLSRAPWDRENRLSSARRVYQQYAALNYGGAARAVSGILNENEAFGSDFAECQGTAMLAPWVQAGGGLFSRLRPESELHKCLRQLETVRESMRRTASAAERERLRLMSERLNGVRYHLTLNRDFGGYQWQDLPGAMESWVHTFVNRATDVSSLGNVVSVQNRFVQLRYLPLEKACRTRQTVRAPSQVAVRGTRQGGLITWNNDEPAAAGFNVHRDGRKLTSPPLPPGANSYADRFDGPCRYTVTVVDAAGRESPPSAPVACAAGAADREPPRLVVLSPPSSVAPGQGAAVHARVVDSRSYEVLTATLFYRVPPQESWTELQMQRRIKGAFAVEIPAAAIGPAGLEYYLVATDGDNSARFPVSAPDTPLTLVQSTADPSPLPGTPTGLGATNRVLSWTAPTGNVAAYRVFRGTQPEFTAGPASYVTYVPGTTTRFEDGAPGFDGAPLGGPHYYRVSAVNPDGGEGQPGRPVRIDYPAR